jgi:hypothetical protein
MMANPDFDTLRAKRDAAIAAMAQTAFNQLFPDADSATAPRVVHLNFGGGSTQCYCGCADGGPCEHQFDGWREFEDGLGGEQFCQRCGMGAMPHSMNTCWD